MQLGISQEIKITTVEADKLIKQGISYLTQFLFHTITIDSFMLSTMIQHCELV